MTSPRKPSRKPATANKKPTPATVSTRHPGGRPSKYREAFAEQGYKLALLKATDTEIADFFEVNPDTVHEWKKVHPEFSESLRAGKLKADTEVAAKLLDRAIGSTWTEDFATKCKTVIYEDGRKVSETEEIKTVPVRRAAPPDTQAISLWLRNRRGQDWRETLHTTVTSAPLPEQDKALLDDYAKAD